MTFIEDVEKLAELRDRGILTDAEFAEKKTQLLARDQGDASEVERSGLAYPRAAAAVGATDKLLIEQRVSNEKPSQGLAYVLWFFTCLLGGHRFYLGRTGSAVFMLVLSVTIVGLVVTVPWALIDLFLIPGLVRDKTDVIRSRLVRLSLEHSPA